jgi:hypothetical protein
MSKEKNLDGEVESGNANTKPIVIHDKPNFGWILYDGWIPSAKLRLKCWDGSETTVQFRPGYIEMKSIGSPKPYRVYGDNNPISENEGE